MAAGRIVIPQWMPALSANGIPIPNAKMFFYENKTTTLKSVFADDGLSTPLPNPIAANSDGKFPLVWGDASDLYSVVIEAPYGPPGVPFTYDDVRPGGIRAVGGYAGGWDASANVPEIISGVGDEGTWYTVEVAGSTNIDGISTWEVGDQILFSAGSWTRVLYEGLVKDQNLADIPDGNAARLNIGVPDFPAAAAAAVSNIPAPMAYLKTAGYAEVGDGGGALYRRVSTEPSHTGKFQSADGAWWSLSETEVTPEMFGAKGDWNGTTGTDDTAAMQAFFDFMEVARCPGRLLQRRYRLTDTIYGGRKGGFRLTGVSKTFSADNQWASTLIFDVPNGTNGLYLANEVATARRDGIEIDGLQIYRVNKEPLGGGGVGITYKGLVQGIFKNITVHRFDINGYITEATGGGASSGCVFDTVRYEGGATAGCVLDACIESDFRHGKFGNGKYGLWIKRSPSNYRPNGNYFAKLTFISDGPAPNDCDHNLFDDNSGGYFNVFSECAFEGASLQNIHGRGGAEVTVMNATFDNCWFNAGIGGTLLFNDYNHQVGGGSRVHSNSTTSPCVTLKRTTAGANVLVSIISGNHITYLTECGVKIDGWNGAVITDNVCQDRSTGFDLPFVIITAAAGSERNIVASNRLRTGHQPGYVDLSGPQQNLFRNNTTSSGLPVGLGADLIGAPSRTVGGATAIRQTHGGNGNGASELLSRGSNDAGPPRRFFYKTRATTPTSRASVQNVDEIGVLDFYADDGAADVRAGYVRAVVDGSPSTGMVPLGFAFGTRDSTGISDRLYINPHGLIGVATINPQFRLDVRGPIASMPEGGDPQINGQMVMQTSTSGIRFKWKDPATGDVKMTAYVPWV